MIHGTYGTSIKAYLTLEEKRIDTAKAVSQIRYLCKFTNDMTKVVKYAYPTISATNDRHVRLLTAHNTTDNVLLGRVNFKPFGYWTYEVYEVSWHASAEVTLETETAPVTETQVLAAAISNGVVQGKVETGKVYITETAGSEQVRYTEHTETTTNYLYTN